MFFVDQLTDTETWSLGDFAGKNRGKPVIARADMHRKLILEMLLSLEPTRKDHPRHVNITGWPTDKDEQKALALEFCAKSALYLRS